MKPYKYCRSCYGKGVESTSRKFEDQPNGCVCVKDTTQVIPCEQCALYRRDHMVDKRNDKIALRMVEAAEERNRLKAIELGLIKP